LLGKDLKLLGKDLKLIIYNAPLEVKYRFAFIKRMKIASLIAHHKLPVTSSYENWFSITRNHYIIGVLSRVKMNGFAALDKVS